MFNVICMDDAPVVHSFLLFVNSTVCFTLGRNICIRSPGQNWDEPRNVYFTWAIPLFEFSSTFGNPGVICCSVMFWCYSVMKLDRDFVKLLEG